MIVSNRIVLFHSLLVKDRSSHIETRNYSVLRPLFFHKKKESKQGEKEVGRYDVLAEERIFGVAAAGLVASNDWRVPS